MVALHHCIFILQTTTMRYCICLLAFCIAITVRAQQPADFTGDWNGKISAFNLTLVFHITEKEGKLNATMDSPDQGAKGIPCDQVMVNGNTIMISLTAIGANFNGQLSADKKIISGKFNQGGGSYDLTIGKDGIPAPKLKPQTPVPPFPYQSEDVEYDNTDKTVHLGATLTYPTGGKHLPAVLLISGSGQQDRNSTLLGHQPFAVLADRLTQLGFAVLRVDDRGIGKSTGEVKKATSADFAKDAMTSLAYLKKRKEIDTNRIGLMGHSEGGLIAALVGAQRKDIAFMVLLAGPGESGYELMAEQCEQVLLKNGLTQDAATAYMPFYKKIMQIAVTSTDSTAMAEKAWKALKEWKAVTKPEYQKAIGLDSEAGTTAIMENLLDGFSMPWMKFFIQSNAAVLLEQTHARVLALNGEKDIQVIAPSNTSGIQKALQKSKSPLYEVKILPGLNHLFQHCNTCTINEYGTLDETFAESALTEITAWLKKNVL